MTTIYNGNRSYFVDDETGHMWDSDQKKVRYNPMTWEPYAVGTGPIEKKIVIPMVPIEKNPLECEVCKFVAKTKAGLAIHKMGHK